MVKSCTGNEIFHFIQYKILGLGYRKREIELGWESNYSFVKALGFFSSYPILEQKWLQFTNSHRKKVFPA